MKKTYNDETGREIDIKISVEADCLGGGEWSPGLRVFLDEDGDARVEATSWHSSDNTTLMSVWHGRDHEWSRRLGQGVLAVADIDKLEAIAEELAPLLIRVREGLSIDWDGSNMRGRLDDDASEAATEVRRLVSEADWQEGEADEVDEAGLEDDRSTAWDAAEWLWEIRGRELTAETTDEEIEALAAEWEDQAERDHVVLRGDVSALFTRWRDELIGEQEAA